MMDKITGFDGVFTVGDIIKIKGSIPTYTMGRFIGKIKTSKRYKVVNVDCGSMEIEPIPWWRRK
jgi:hypothetical protein